MKATEQEIEDNWKKFWAPILTKEDGSIDIEQLKKELFDFSTVINEVPKVYSHITNNMLSYPTYAAETVISVYEECLEDLIKERLKEELNGEQND